MRPVDSPPFAPALIESMRAVGYTLESAIADIVDNSISARARNVDIRFSPYQNSFVAIVDDGDGMSAHELIAAMRHGSRNPNDVRGDTDLGRFGLGLKTASLSQARQLTVVSRKNGMLAGAQWDLDVVAETRSWTLLVLEPDDLGAIPFVDQLLKSKNGTLVLWRNLDRLSEAEGTIEQALREGMTKVRQHLALVFHRFLSAEVRKTQVTLRMNNNPVTPFDPFLTWHPATQQLPAQEVRIHGATVGVQPYILPHYSKLSPDELQLAGGEEGLRRQQGFYIYRNRRLIVWGTWFRLARQLELTKLARVRVDIPNSLDSLWTLDIKKSAASPPLEVRQNLSTIVGRIAEGSGRVYRFRGRRVSADKFVHMWDRVEEREGGRYTVNREHPLYAAFVGELDGDAQSMFSDLVDTIEGMLPVDVIYADMAGSDGGIGQRPTYTPEELADLAAHLLNACAGSTAARENLLSKLSLLEPFSFYPDESAALIRRLSR